jgi:hypothetical protein
MKAAEPRGGSFSGHTCELKEAVFLTVVVDPPVNAVVACIGKPMPRINTRLTSNDFFMLPPLSRNTIERVWKREAAPAADLVSGWSAMFR